ncbi:hypothetical protein GRI62_10335 [Erythrobacter arachoides]|uniref:Uncharacterized protein n=1 Tax=Aurantiacibacter arachoides TaxID=1850444 RepID=A0A845A241_9SPHN|nr:hypothetical protein [Aurantiacibacter arachoides]MXO93998.1 hypothetical protein [Aurantiacibacter arachoides]GGD44914.1 hypothetical protein GCM10011411_00680 [Aurantiacibacter arachoides]
MLDPYLLASWLFLLAALAISWQAGNSKDRTVIIGIAIMAGASASVYSFLDYQSALYANLGIDTALLLWVTRYGVTGEKFWPIWFAGFHAVTVFFELGAILLPDDLRMVAWRLGTFWFLPAFSAMAVGLTLDRRRTQSRQGIPVTRE